MDAPKSFRSTTYCTIGDGSPFVAMALALASESAFSRER
jgi:hypothetical protein